MWAFLFVPTTKAMTPEQMETALIFVGGVMTGLYLTAGIFFFAGNTKKEKQK